MKRLGYLALALFGSSLALVINGCGGGGNPVEPPPAIMVSVSPGTASVQAGTPAQFTASVSNDPSAGGVSWTIKQSGTQCSPACGTISPETTKSGVPTTYTAPAIVPAGSAVKIVAISAGDTSKSGSAAVTITPPPVISVAIAPTYASMGVNTTQKFTATVQNDPSNQDVAWAVNQNGDVCASVCGTIAPSPTASGAPTTYTAPVTVPADPSVSIIATLVADMSATGASVSITNDTVNLVPNLLKFGTVTIGVSTPPQSTTIINTATTDLNITGIQITGAVAGDYSQTNDCGSVVAAGKFCTINVIFKPTATGFRNTSLTITDNSVGSPQTVMLTGKGKKSTATSAALIAQANTTITVPKPTGFNNVGTRVMTLIDGSNNDPFLANSARRELGVRFWYPMRGHEVCRPAEYTSPRVWNYVSQLVGFPLPTVKTNSCLDAPITAGAHPIVLFTPGYSGTFTDYTFIFEDLASRGYVVASLNHTHEAAAVEFADGRFVKSVFGSHLGHNLRGDVKSMAFALAVRLKDLQFVLSQLESLNTQVGSPFFGKLDTSNIALAGHSMGAVAALMGIKQNPRFKAGIIIDGETPDALLSATTTPTLLLGMGPVRWEATECRLWGNLHGPRFAVNLVGAEHLTPSDAVWLAKSEIEVSPMGRDKTMAAVRDYIAAFLDVNLRGKVWHPLLTGPSRDYPDAAVTTQNQSPCAGP